MLITSLLPLLARYGLGFDLVAGTDGVVTLTILPRKAACATNTVEAGELRPISITGTAAEIDEELARGTDGALGQLIAARKSLADQLAEQRVATEQSKTAASAKAKPAAKPAAAAAPTPTPAPAPQPVAESKPGEPASLW